MAAEEVTRPSKEQTEGWSTLETIRKAIGDCMRQSSQVTEPNLRERLEEEQRSRSQLEKQIQELSDESRRARQGAERTDRHSQVQTGLRELGVQKVELAFRLVKDAVYRGDDGELYADLKGAAVPYRKFLKDFVSENPEFLPPRISGGSGASGMEGQEISGAIDLDKIRPGMSREEMAEAWKEVARLAGQRPQGW